MDNGGGLDIRGWGCYGNFLKGNLGLQLMSAQPVERDTKPLLGGRDPSPYMMNGNNFYQRDCGVPQPSLPMEFVRDSWINQRDKHFNMLQGNSNFGLLSETSGSQAMQMIPQPDFMKDERMVRMDEVSGKTDGSMKKRGGGRVPKSPKAKKPKKAVAVDGMNGSVQRVKPPRKTIGLVINGIDMDLSSMPAPICSCTGAPQQCYRWGCGGWQSACCTTSLSMYPLPMSTKRRGARIAGRKMSQGAFKKVLEKLASEGFNFSRAIDLRSHWAKHGTNKFVTIR